MRSYLGTTYGPCFTDFYQENFFNTSGSAYPVTAHLTGSMLALTDVKGEG